MSASSFDGPGRDPGRGHSAPWHFTTWLDLFDHWQTVIAGFLALLAAFTTVVVTMIIARRQIAVSREQADMTDWAMKGRKNGRLRALSL